MQKVCKNCKFDTLLCGNKMMYGIRDCKEFQKIEEVKSAKNHIISTNNWK